MSKISNSRYMAIGFGKVATALSKLSKDFKKGSEIQILLKKISRVVKEYGGYNFNYEVLEKGLRELDYRDFIFKEVNKYYKDMERTKLWYHTRNPFFDYRSPKEMFDINRQDKVIKEVIKASKELKDGNQRY